MMQKVIALGAFVFLSLLVIPSRVSAYSSDCWKEFSAVKPICDQSVAQRNACTDPDLNSPCYKKSQVLLDQCDQANNAVHSCLGLDTAPWSIETKTPGHMTCQEWKMIGIAGTAENCVFPVTETSEKKLWCLNSAADIPQIRSRTVDYLLDFEPERCYPITEDDLRQFREGLPLKAESAGTTEAKIGRNKVSAPSPFALFGVNPYETWLALQSLLYLNSSSFIEDTEMLALTTTGHAAAFEKMQQDRSAKEVTTNTPGNGNTTNRTQINGEELKSLGILASVDDMLNRTPELTEQIIKQAQDDWDRMMNPPGPEPSTPYRLDILKGNIQIRLPGKSEWSSIKQGDTIPPGSTIFTGMDATTVLSIKNKGVVLVLPFTEIVISEQGLEDAAAEKKTTTNIQLITGEIEMNIDRGMFGPSFQVFTTNAVAGVRGTHFWVRADKNTRTSTVGVYTGEVEVKSRRSSASTLITPNGKKPGIVVVAQKVSVGKLAGLGVAAIITVVGGIAILKKKRIIN